MNEISFLMPRYDHVLELNNSLLNDAIGNSQGHPHMSEEDLKMAVLSLQGIVQLHEILIRELLDTLAEEPKKKFWKFWK